jgi:hypothetical protein
MSTNFSAPRSAPKPASGGHHRAAAVGDVGERSAVDEGGGALERLDQVGRERVAQECGHGALGAEVAGGHRRHRAGVADHDVADASLEVGPGLGEAEDRHQL